MDVYYSGRLLLGAERRTSGSVAGLGEHTGLPPRPCGLLGQDVLGRAGRGRDVGVCRPGDEFLELAVGGPQAAIGSDFAVSLVSQLACATCCSRRCVLRGQGVNLGRRRAARLWRAAGRVPGWQRRSAADLPQF
jgi:hypothetical protein